MTSSLLPSASSLSDALARARDNAPYLKMLLEVQPELADLLDAENLDAAFDYCAQAGVKADNVRQKLRREKRALALTLAIGDLAGNLSLTDVITRLSDFADRALDEALADIYATRYPDAPLEGFSIIGLGKHGSRELNYSSDIDPIFIYDPERIPVRGREEPSDAARRIGQQLVEALNSRDADGYVFRVDMRLRPKRRAAIMNRARWRGSRRPISVPGPPPAIGIWGAIFSKRSIRSSGGGRWTTGRSAISDR